MQNTYEEWFGSLQGDNLEDGKLYLNSYKETDLKYETVLDLQEFIGEQIRDIKPLGLIEVTKRLLEHIYYYEEFKEWAISLTIVYNILTELN
jgi:hypothetical protein